jgi:hypothetical protein
MTARIVVIVSALKVGDPRLERVHVHAFFRARYITTAITRRYPYDKSFGERKDSFFVHEKSPIPNSPSGFGGDMYE